VRSIEIEKQKASLKFIYIQEWLTVVILLALSGYIYLVQARTAYALIGLAMAMTFGNVMVYILNRIGGFTGVRFLLPVHMTFIAIIAVSWGMQTGDADRNRTSLICA
jgi:hypothetical protein